MKSTFLALAVSACLVGVCGPASADSYPPSPTCRKPTKPYKFTSQWELDQFKSDVERYKRCISDFVDEQNEAVRNHQEAAQDAIDEWNRYVRNELN
jgi:hypothetical protein